MFKQILSVLAIALVMVSEGNAQQAGQPAAHPSGTAIVRKHAGLKFATVVPLSSTSSKAGDDVPLRLVDPLIINDVTVLPAGEVVHARVVKVKKADKHCNNGEVKLALDKLTFADSSTVKVEVWSLTASPDAPVASRLYNQVGLIDSDLEVNNWWEAFLSAPAFILEFAVLAPFMPFAPLILLSSCHAAGKEISFPVNSTVAVEVRQNHKVRY